MPWIFHCIQISILEAIILLGCFILTLFFFYGPKYRRCYNFQNRFSNYICTYDFLEFFNYWSLKSFVISTVFLCKFLCATGAAGTLHGSLWFISYLQLLNNRNPCSVKKIVWKFSILTERLNVYIAAHAIILYLNKLLSIKAYGQSLYNSSDFLGWFPKTRFMQSHFPSVSCASQ